MKINKFLKEIKQNTQKSRAVKGFTLGLALIIVAATLLISISITTLLLREIKNSSANTLNSIAYTLAESGLECVSGFEENIRYFDLAGVNVTGLFPTSTSYVYDVAKSQNETPPSAGYAGRYYTTDNQDNKNKTFTKDQIKCFGYKIVDDVSGAPSIDGSYTKISNNDATAPLGYYSAIPVNNGVVTEIKIKKDISDIDVQNNVSFFEKYLKNVCIDISIYSVYDTNIYKKLIVSEASVPCTGKYVSKRLLVKYLQ
jgi:hypothetical protein